jgi:sulfide:quinone oxidoreductase
MQRTRLTDTLSIGPQIQPADVSTLKQAGFRAIVCNRPDGEGAGQPGHKDMAQAAQAAGLEFRYLPVTPGNVTSEIVAAFGKAIDELPGPVFAYCRSGARSSTLWSLAADRRP